MKRIILITAVMTFYYYVSAQDVVVKEMQNAASKEIKSLDSNGWHKNGLFILNLYQGALGNWVAGGEESTLGVNGIFNYAINYKKNKHIWDNYFDLALGFQNAASFERFRKIDDRIDITSKYGYQIARQWYASLLLNFYSQFLPGYDYSVTPSKKISNFLTPGKVILSPGFNYKTKERFSLVLSPVTLRWMLKTDPDFYNLNVFGVDSASKVYTEFGAYISARYHANFTKWAEYAGRLDLFSNYRRNPENVDFLMNNLFTFRFSKFFAVNFSLDLIYDDDVLSRLQWKEILGLGLTVKL